MNSATKVSLLSKTHPGPCPSIRIFRMARMRADSGFKWSIAAYTSGGDENVYTIGTSQNKTVLVDSTRYRISRTYTFSAEVTNDNPHTKIISIVQTYGSHAQ